MGGGGFGIISGILGGALNRPELLIAVLPLWLIATYGTARTIYSGTSRRRRLELGELADRLAAIVAEEVGAARRLPGGS